MTGGHHLRVSQSKSAIHSNGLKKRVRASRVSCAALRCLAQTLAAARRQRNHSGVAPRLRVCGPHVLTALCLLHPQSDGMPGMDGSMGHAGAVGYGGYGGAPAMPHAVPGAYGMPGAGGHYGYPQVRALLRCCCLRIAAGRG